MALERKQRRELKYTRTEKLTEYADSKDLQLTEEDSVIKGVKVLGVTSRNGRDYPRATIEAAKNLYEGAKVNVNHREKPTDSRRYEDRIGILENVHLRPGDEGLFGDFRFNPKHQLAEQIKWDAQHAPENLGFSHDIRAQTIRRDGRVIIEQILKVESVDLVANPATTNGLFENVESTEQEDEMKVTLESIKVDYPELIEEIKKEITANLNEAEQIKKLQDENAKITKELEELRLKDKIATDSLAIDKAIEEAGIPKDYAGDIFRVTLLEANDERRKQLIEDRKQLVESIKKSQATKTPQSKEQQTTSVDENYKPASSGKEFAEAIKSSF